MRRCKTCKINKKNAEFDNHKRKVGLACKDCKAKTTKAYDIKKEYAINRLVLKNRYYSDDPTSLVLSYDEFENIKGLEWP